MDAADGRRLAGARRRALGSRRRRAFQRIVARGEETAEADWAHSVHAEPAGLAPARWYWYRFTALGQQSGVGRTRTAPAADAAATLRFAIASCQRYDVGHYAAWRHVAAENLDVVFFLGDYIYEYATRPGAVRPLEGGEALTLEQYRARYATHKSDPLLQAAHAAAPWLLVWDDHEVSNDYANLRGQDLRRTSRRAAPPPTAPTGSTCRFRSRRGRSAPTCASSAGSTGARWRASTSSTTASTATSRPARSPAAAARTPWRSPSARS